MALFSLAQPPPFPHFPSILGTSPEKPSFTIITVSLCLAFSSLCFCSSRDNQSERGGDLSAEKSDRHYHRRSFFFIFESLPTLLCFLASVGSESGRGRECVAGVKGPSDVVEEEEGNSDTSWNCRFLIKVNYPNSFFHFRLLMFRDWGWEYMLKWDDF